MKTESEVLVIEANKPNIELIAKGIMIATRSVVSTDDGTKDSNVPFQPCRMTHNVDHNDFTGPNSRKT